MKCAVYYVDDGDFYNEEVVRKFNTIKEARKFLKDNCVKTNQGRNGYVCTYEIRKNMTNKGYDVVDWGYAR